MKRLQNILTVVLFVLLLAGVFFGGYKYYAFRNPCAEIVDTLYIYDTVEHRIPDTVPWYITKRDSIKYRDQKWMDSVIMANRVDTFAILRDYYAIHYYSREWFDPDSIVYITSEDAISENLIIDNVFSFKLLKPQTVVNNVVGSPSVYSRYLTGGLDIPLNGIKGLGIEGEYITSKYYLGARYVPTEKSMSIKAGLVLWRFK
jgi:hypothetical protein